MEPDNKTMDSAAPNGTRRPRVGRRVLAVVTVLALAAGAALTGAVPASAADASPIPGVVATPRTGDLRTAEAGGKGVHTAEWKNDGSAPLSGLSVDVTFPREVVAATPANASTFILTVLQSTPITVSATPGAPTAPPLNPSLYPAARPVLNPSDGKTISGTVPSNSFVTVTSNGGVTYVATGDANADGTFSLPLVPAQPPGTVLTVSSFDPNVWADHSGRTPDVASNCLTPFAHHLVCDLPGFILPPMRRSSSTLERSSRRPLR
ncbi:Ig-like domain-containing protein [Leifsonia poae]|uniref:Ig-like domain-containing protein n=1 Tax=Leifsonia poae TaxID=110933 RepID=UPI003D671E46